MRLIKWIFVLTALLAFNAAYSRGTSPYDSIPLIVTQIVLLGLGFAFGYRGEHPRPLLMSALCAATVFVFWRLHWSLIIWIFLDIRQIIQPVEVLNASAYFWVMGAVHAVLVGLLFLAGLGVRKLRGALSKSKGP